MSLNHIAKRPKFFIFDGIVSMPLLLVMLYPRMITLYILLGVSFTLFLLEQRGITLFVLMRKIRTFFIGNKRYIRPYWRRQL